MTSYIELCELAESDNILTIDGVLNKCPSMAICEDGLCAIIIDYDQIINTAELKEKFAHELGHCETMSFYNEHTLETRERMEYRANKWAIKKLIPEDELKEAIQNGYTELWQIAEYFGVTEDVVRFAVWVYFDREI